jgi:hypothetical protein
MVTRSHIAWMLCALPALACRPDVSGRPSELFVPRVLAIRSVPAEAPKSASIEYDALLAGPEGAVDPSGLDWALCNQRKPLTVSGPISLECRKRTSEVLTPLGFGAQVTGDLPDDVCNRFGPFPPPPAAEGEPSERPADPDTTGGFYQPVRVVTDVSGMDEYTAGQTRLICGGLPGAAQEVSVEYVRTLVPNTNTALDGLSAERDGGDEEEIDTTPDGTALTVSPLERLTFKTRWAECNEEPGCGEVDCPQVPDEERPHCTGSEPYNYLDPISRQLVVRRESIRVSWFATAGSFQSDRTGRAADDTLVPTTENAWVAPPADRSPVYLWAVIRDDRGGVGWSQFKVEVTE